MKPVRCLIALCALFFCIAAGAQGRVDVKAVLVDSGTGEPVGFATVSITREGEDDPAKYTLSDEKGNVTLSSVRRGTYVLKAELLGYKTYTTTVKVENETVDLGKVKFEPDATQLDAATVAAIGNPVIIKKDTVEYNATSFSTTDNDVLEDLLKKLPGVEVSDDGSITANGETISKITIDGKTFFLDDPQLASKNIPAKMINKLKIIQKKSEQAEFTGIDDGEEETVIDLSVQPGMMRGLFGNVLAGAGADIPASSGTESELRYQGSAFMGRFTDKSQISVILNGNNVNNQGGTNLAGNMMRGMRGGMGGSGGITTSYMAGINAAGDLFDDKMEIGGNYLWNSSDNVVSESSVRTNYLTDKNLIYNSEGASSNHSDGHRFGLRLEHEFSENTSILFQPQVNFGRGWYAESSSDETFNDDLMGNVTKLSDSFAENRGNNRNVSASGFLLFRQRLGIPGRTLTANVNFSVSDNVLDGINRNGTTSYDELGNTLSVEDVNQSFTNDQRSYSVTGRVTYTEPLGNHFYVEANYSYSWNRSNSDKQTYDLNNGGAFDEQYSNSIINENNRQEIGVNALFQNEDFRAQVGFAAMPTKTYNSTTRFNSETGEYSPVTYDDFRWNFSPQISLFADFSELSSMRLFYRGTSSQPSTSQLMPVPDNTDPMNISFGNPSLTPYFSHSLRGDYRYSNREKFSSFNIRFNGGYVQNPIVNVVWYGTNGGQYTMPFNGPASFNGSLNGFANLPLDSEGVFTLSNTLGASYRQSSSYVGTDVDMSVYEQDGYYAFMDDFIDKFVNDPDWFADHIDRNTTRTLSANDRLRLRYRGSAIEAMVGASTRMNRSWYSISNANDNTTTWNNSVSASLTWNWEGPGISIESDFDYNWYNGYSTQQPSESILNAEISKLLFNDTMTLAIRGYDILGQSRNLMVSDSANYHSESVNNTLGRYVIVSLTWRFGTMGGGRGGFRGPGPGGTPPGGPR